MKIIKKNKEAIIVLITVIISFLFVFISSNNKICKLGYSKTVKNAILLLITFSYIIFLVCVFFSFESKKIYSLLAKTLLPVMVAIAFIYVDNKIMCFIPYLLPGIVLALDNNLYISYIFQVIICIIYYFTGVFNAEIIIMFMLAYMICLYFIKHSDDFEKKIFSCIISLFTYIIISCNYQLIVHNKVSILIILKGLFPLIISILPMYFEFIKEIFNNIYVKDKLNYLSNDENELLLSLLEHNSQAYMHSLQVADTAVRVAKILKCNEKLVNVAARYHEIGKISTGNYIEEGIKIMRNNHFPHEVIKIVSEHNSKSNFPKTKESAIVMLSDSIESTLFKISEKNGYNVEKKKVVSQIIDIRFDSGSLDYAFKNIQEYRELKNAFISLY